MSTSSHPPEPANPSPLELTSANLAFAEEMYARYQADPGSVDESWQALFRAAPAAAPPAPPAAPAPVAAAPAPTPAPAVAAPANEAAPADAPPKKIRRSRKALEHFGDPDAEAPPPAPVAAKPVAPPPSVPLPAAPAVVAQPKGAEPPPMEIPPNATPEMVARILTMSPSPTQRLELIAQLRGIKNAATVAALRANAQSQHPGVRAAAEAAMEAMFGPQWNRTRAVPKPIQAPPADDKDRGPPGGW